MKRLALLAPIFLATSAFAQVVLVPQQPIIVTNPIIGTVNAGTTMTVHAATSPDHRYVNMNISLHDERLDGFDTIIYGGVGNATGLPGVVTPFGGGGGGVIQLPRTSGVNLLGRGGAPVGGVVGLGGISNVATFESNSPDRLIPFNAKTTEITSKMINEAPVLRANQVTLLASDDSLLSRPTAALKGSYSLAEAVRQVAGDTKTNIHLAANVLTQAKVDVNAKQDFDIPAGNIEKTLVYILAYGVKDTPVAIKAEDNIIRITTRDQVDQQIVTRSYPFERVVAYLHHLDPKDTDFAKVEKTAAGKPTTDTAITRGVMKMIRPEVWKANGGKTGIVIQDGDKIVIQAPISVHAELPIEEIPQENEKPADHRYGTVPKKF